MNISGIISRFFSKSKSFPPANSWGGWLDTAEGKRSQAVGSFVYEILDDTKVSATRRIVFFDGKKMTLNQTISVIKEKSEFSREEIREHALMWLVEASEPIEHDSEELDDEEIDELIQVWVRSEQKLGQP